MPYGKRRSICLVTNKKPTHPRLGFGMFNKIKFKTMSEAKNMQNKFKKDYGYTPKIFKENNSLTGKTEYIVVKPYGLRKINW